MLTTLVAENMARGQVIAKLSRRLHSARKRDRLKRDVIRQLDTAVKALGVEVDAMKRDGRPGSIPGPVQHEVRLRG